MRGWSGDIVDAVKSAAMGTGTGLAVRAVLRVASGAAYNVAFAAALGGLGVWTGVVAVDWRRLNALLRSVGVPDALLDTRDSFFRKIDADGDGRLTPNDVRAIKSELRRLAGRNEHHTFGGVAGFASAFVLV